MRINVDVHQGVFKGSTKEDIWVDMWSPEISWWCMIIVFIGLMLHDCKVLTKGMFIRLFVFVVVVCLWPPRLYTRKIFGFLRIKRQYRKKKNFSGSDNSETFPNNFESSMKMFGVCFSYDEALRKTWDCNKILNSLSTSPCLRSSADPRSYNNTGKF